MKIGHKITFFIFFITFICSAICLVYVYRVVKHDLMNRIEDKSAALARSRTAHINTYLDMLEISIGQLSKSVVLEDFLRVNSKDSLLDGEAFRLAMIRLKRTKEANNSVYEFLLLDAHGKVVVSSNELNLGVDKSTDAFFLGGQKKTFIKDVYYLESIHDALIAVSAPILDSRTGRFLGVLVARVRLDGLNDILTEHVGLGKTGEVYVVNKYGFMITPARFLENTLLKQRVNTLGFKEALLHRSGEVHILPEGHKELSIYPDYRGELVLGSFENVPRMQWVVLAEVDASEAFTPLVRMRNIFVLVFIIILISSGLLGALVSKAIAGPIHRLHVGAEIIGGGNLDYKIGIETKDEVGQLSMAFDQMTENLKKHTVSIEEWDKTFNSITDLVFIQDNDFTIQKVNKACAEALKMEPKDIVGKKCYGLMHNLGHPWPCCPYEKAKNDCASHVEEVNDPNIGMSLLVSVSPILDSNGKIIGAVHIARDITERKRVEVALRKSEEQYRTLFDESRDAVMILDPNNGFISGNPAAFKMFGCRDEKEFVTQSPNSLSPQYQPDGSLSSVKSKDMMDLALEKGSNIFEWMHKRIDGAEFITTVLISRFKLGDNILLQANVRDITEEKKTELALRESEEWFSTTLNSIGDAIIATDTQGNISFINSIAQDLTGWKRVEAIGRHIDEVFFIRKEDTEEKADNPVLKVLANGLVSKLASHTILVSKNGNKYAIDDSAAPISSASNEGIIGVVLVFRDVTDRNNREKRLRQLSVAVEQSPVCVVITDLKGNIQYVNPKFISLTGYANEDVMGKSLKILKTEEQSETSYENLWDTINAGKEWRGEFHSKKKNGDLYWESASVSPIRNKDGVITNFIALKEDITERKRLERLKDDFVSTISHELRTPLTAIKEGISIVADGSSGTINDEQQEFLEIAKRNVDRLARLINEVLDFQKLEFGSMTFNIAENDIVKVSEEVKGSMAPLASNKGLELLFEAEKGLPAIKFDRDKITQVLTNLINNAIKFTDKGSITISIKSGENVIRVSVKDTGPGMKEKDIAKLFEKFVQLESLSDRKTGGTGLGLAISKDIILAHKGKIWAESEIGKGSVFSFVLPIEDHRGVV